MQSSCLSSHGHTGQPLTGTVQPAAVAVSSPSHRRLVSSPCKTQDYHDNIGGLFLLTRR